MSERHKPHLGRDRSGHRKVRVVDVDDLLTDGPDGAEYLKDDVRLGGAVIDAGAHAGEAGARIHALVEENREAVARVIGRDGRGTAGPRARGRDGGMR